MAEFHDIAFTARPEDKNAAGVWLTLTFLAQWEFDGPNGAPRGRCAVSLPRLAALARVCPRTARKGVQMLAELGLLRVERVMSGGKILATRYTLLPWHDMGESSLCEMAGKAA